MDKSIIMWGSFIIVVITLLIMDLGILNKENKEISFRKSLLLSAFYIFIAVLFGIWIGYELNITAAKEYFTGYLIEKSLSIDNIFIISLIFRYFSIPSMYQHRVLFWGILGVIVLRALMIALGAILVSEFEWVLYIFGIFLIVTGIKMLQSINHDFDIANHGLLKFLKNRLPITDQLHKEKFLVSINDYSNNSRLHATPLLLSLILIEFIDLIFAIDSVPAIFAITHDPYIVYTSNIFAILGLRALYFAFSSIIERFKYLKYSLAIILIFVGSKIFITHFFGKIPPIFSLSITILLLIGGVVFSIIKTKPIKS